MIVLSNGNSYLENEAFNVLAIHKVHISLRIMDILYFKSKYK